MDWRGSASRIQRPPMRRTQLATPRNPSALKRVSSLRSEESQFALHSPPATHLVSRSQPRNEARNRRTRYIIERRSPRAGAVVRAWRRGAFVASSDGCWQSNVLRRHYVTLRPSSPAPGRLLWLSDVALGGPLTALARDGGPTSSVAGSAVGPRWLSDVLCARGPAP